MSQGLITRLGITPRTQTGIMSQLVRHAPERGVVYGAVWRRRGGDSAGRSASAARPSQHWRAWRSAGGDSAGRSASAARPHHPCAGPRCGRRRGALAARLPGRRHVPPQALRLPCRQAGSRQGSCALSMCLAAAVRPGTVVQWSRRADRLHCSKTGVRHDAASSYLSTTPNTMARSCRPSPRKRRGARTAAQVTLVLASGQGSR